MSTDDWMTAQDLHFAAADNDLAEAERLLKAGRDPNTFDEIAHTPLHYAAKNEHLEMVRLLLLYGANVNAHHESQIGDTPLATVAQTCSLDMARLLLNSGANPTIRGSMRLNAIDRAKKRKRGEGPQVSNLILQYAERFS